MSFPAAYPDTCGCCGDYFKTDTEVAFTDLDGLVIASHLREKKPQPVCPKCFMELPLTGICGTCD